METTAILAYCLGGAALALGVGLLIAAYCAGTKVESYYMDENREWHTQE
jgi:hypothetical protein